MLLTDKRGIPQKPTNVKIKKKCFSVTGKKDFISCFHCGLTISDWQEMNYPVQQHSRLSPKCIYLRHTMENWKILRDRWAKSDTLAGSRSLNKIFCILKWSVFKTSLANIWLITNRYHWPSVIIPTSHPKKGFAFKLYIQKTSKQQVRRGCQRECIRRL